VRTLRSGRKVDRLLADFGHPLPAAAPPAVEPREPRLFQPTSPRGQRRRGRGWSPATAPVATWRMTSDQAGALWPFVTRPGLPATGAQMGFDFFSRGSFFADPHGWVLEERVSNPNIFCFGEPGLGKSATTKAFCLRMMGFGYRTLILGDVKAEYEAMCHALGVEPITIGPGLPARINPLDFGPLRQGWDQLDAIEAQRRADIVFSRWLVVLRGLVGSQKIGHQPVPVGPTEEAVVDASLRLLTGYTAGNTQLTETTIPRLWWLLHEPTNDLVETCRYASVRHFLDDTRLLRDSLGQLTHGALRGLFDDYTSINIDWSAPIQSLSLAQLEALGDEAVGMALLCLNSWGRAMREVAEPGDLRIVVRDESWKQLRLGIEAVMSFDADLRLSRRDGDIQLAIAHKPSDLLSAGDLGSQAATIAKDLLHLTSTKILHGQPQQIADELAGILGLSPIATNLVTDWCRQVPGRALWLVGPQIHKVQTVLHPAERLLTWTNANLEAAA